MDLLRMEMPLLHQNTAGRSLRAGVFCMGTALLLSLSRCRVCRAGIRIGAGSFRLLFVETLRRGAVRLLGGRAHCFGFLQKAEGGTFRIPGWFWFG